MKLLHLMEIIRTLITINNPVKSPNLKITIINSMYMGSRKIILIIYKVILFTQTIISIKHNQHHPLLTLIQTLLLIYHKLLQIQQELTLSAILMQHYLEITLVIAITFLVGIIRQWILLNLMMLLILI